MHEQGVDQDDPKASTSTSKSCSLDITWPGDNVSSHFMNGASHIQHPPNTDQVSNTQQILNQGSHNLGDLAETTADTNQLAPVSNIALTALRAEFERLQRAKEQAISTFDRNINDVATAIRVVEKDGFVYPQA